MNIPTTVSEHAEDCRGDHRFEDDIDTMIRSWRCTESGQIVGTKTIVMRERRTISQPRD